MKPVRVTFFDKEATQVTFQVRESELHTGRWFFIDMPYFERIELQEQILVVELEQPL